MAKQTGPAYAVKGAIALTLTRLAAGCAVAVLLAACGSTWHNAAKNPQEAAADEKQCSADAEDAALARAARQRVDYGARAPGMPGMNRGETPMQMHERVGTEDVFHKQLESCMKSKGYTQGTAK
ncbi:MAG: hypothetical protein K2P94_07820 [Rhodospirillaceae bacterium]|nr:hypothetical protein [Rhodospirillaceae bacterium]